MRGMSLVKLGLVAIFAVMLAKLVLSKIAPQFVAYI